jgi:hypothetical protein
VFELDDGCRGALRSKQTFWHRSSIIQRTQPSDGAVVDNGVSGVAHDERAA